MPSTLIFLDTETTGLELDSDIWEFYAVKRSSRGEEELHMFIEHDYDKCLGLPDRFLEDHLDRYAHGVTRESAAEGIVEFFGAPAEWPTVVGMNPSFDTQRITRLLRKHWPENPDAPGKMLEPWHYHLIDLGPMMLGYIRGRYPNRSPALPYKSDELSQLLGVDPPAPSARHTAVGDVRWATRVYDHIMGGQR